MGARSGRPDADGDQECLTPTTCEDDRFRMEPMMLLVTEHTYIHSSNDPTF